MKKAGILKKIILGILVILGILFLLLLIMPDDEEPPKNNQVKNGTGNVADSSAPSKKENSGKKPSAEAEPVSVGSDAGSATVMIYMNGSDLESKDGQASRDISEMLSSGIGDNVNVIIQTMGTKEWQDYGISSETAQTWAIEKGELVLKRDNLGQLDSTSEKTLSEFIGYCKSDYPADRYFIIFWDHGGGPVYGFGYDEWQDEDSSLTLDEMAKAFKENSDVHFDIIGMDCCIMANLETCYTLSPYCRYALLSEDFESSIGWSYENWMRRLEEEPGISTPLLGKYIVDSVIESNEESDEGASSCLGLFNESAMARLFENWKTYAYKNEDTLLGTNYSKEHMARGRSFFDLWDSDGSYVTLSDYYISDMLALVEGADNSSDAAKELMSSLKAAVAYYGHTSDKNELTGMAVSLPYGDPDFYELQKEVYSALGFDEKYIKWLEGFVSAAGYEDMYDYDSFENEWGGWGDYECEEYDDWTYNYEDELWYIMQDGIWYCYDEVTDTMYYYDEESEEYYEI